jgi:glutathione peroxidase
MRRVVLLSLFGVASLILAGGCGGAGQPGAPAAASDESVQAATTRVPAAPVPRRSGAPRSASTGVLRGTYVLGFPANDFAGQEPRSDAQIATFCKANYGVSFPMFSKTTVTGPSANSLYRALTAAAGAPEWNFNKYLVDRRGRVVARYGAGTEPQSSQLAGRIDALLSAS